MTYRNLFILSLSALFLFSTNCAKHNEKEDKEPTEKMAAQLSDTAGQFYRYMRWEMFEDASTFVDPSFRDEFLNEFNRLKKSIDITDMTLKNYHAVSRDKVVLTTQMQWFRIAQQVEKTAMFKETWEWKENRWYLEKRQRLSDNPSQREFDTETTEESPKEKQEEEKPLPKSEEEKAKSAVPENDDDLPKVSDFTKD